MVWPLKLLFSCIEFFGRVFYSIGFQRKLICITLLFRYKNFLISFRVQVFTPFTFTVRNLIILCIVYEMEKKKNLCSNNRVWSDPTLNLWFPRKAAPLYYVRNVTQRWMRSQKLFQIRSYFNMLFSYVLCFLKYCI